MHSHLALYKRQWSQTRITHEKLNTDKQKLTDTILNTKIKTNDHSTADRKYIQNIFYYNFILHDKASSLNE